jgi:uncharacterized protein (UPF0212 family)
MHALSATELLSVWESGSSQIPLQRALTMLAAACPEVSSDSLALLTIGERDTRLLQLREAMFGAELTGISDCPECGEKVELSFNCSDICPERKIKSSAELAVESNGREVRFRLPTSADLLAVNSSEELLERCVLDRGNHLTKDAFLPAVAEKMSGAEPMADIRLALSCPNCAYKWEAAFDIVAFLWREISAAARRLLHEVHALASAYGWTEPEILALNPARRRAYLELASG